jgi:3-hydroxyisobutyrate dehydrogenase-like beta-hydroxyacid dehydrogenase
MADRGFAGSGLLDSRIVKRLLDAGHLVSGYDRTQAKAGKLVASGRQWHNTLAKSLKPPISLSAWLVIRRLCRLL